jgi:FixJ family two-component response regulator
MLSLSQSSEIRTGAFGAVSGRVVCLVDDDASVRKSVTRLMQSDGFQVVAFSKPEGFLQHLDGNAVPVVVLDIWMEKMTGIDLLKCLGVRSPQTKVIFITGHDDSLAMTAVGDAGPFAFFLKPLKDKPFLEAVHAAFGSYDSDNEPRASET